MITLYLERIAFLVALSAFVSALLWTHANKFVCKIFKTLNVILFGQDDNEVNDISDYQEFNKRLKVVKEHPKFTGRNSKRQTTSEKESIRSTHGRSIANFGQSSLGSDPSFSKALPNTNHLNQLGSSPSSSLLLDQQAAGEFGIRNFGRISGHSTSSSSIFLSLFSTSVIALILYTTMKLLTAKFGSTTNGNTHRLGKRKTNERVTTDLSYNRKKLTSLNRDQRVRQLISHHGSKNVSNAIKFLVNELEKQKQLLFENLLIESENSINNSSLSCSCDNNDDNNNTSCCSCCSCNTDGEKYCNNTNTFTNNIIQDCNNNKYDQKLLSEHKLTTSIDKELNKMQNKANGHNDHNTTKLSESPSLTLLDKINGKVKRKTK